MKRLLIALLAFSCSLAQAQSYSVIGNETMSWNHVPIEFPRGEGQRIITKIVHIPRGTALPWHKHEVQVMGYVLEGELTIEDNQGNREVFNERQSFIEGNNIPHRGLATGLVDTLVLSFYLVVDGKMEFVPVMEKK